MSLFYLPSCKFTAKYPALSKKIGQYMTKRHGASITGCCRPSLQQMGEGDTAVFICNTCAAFLRESSKAGRVISLWELLLEDEEFPLYKDSGRRVTVQDCWRAYDNRPQQDAVRELLRRMGVEMVELEENYERTRFCGTSLYEPLPPRYDELAPKRLGREGASFFKPHTEAEKDELMRIHCNTIETEEVVCSCVACVNGVVRGGKRGIHLAELVFGR